MSLCPESKRNLVDLEELNKRIEQELEKRELESCEEAAKKGKHKGKAMESPKPKILTAETSELRLLRSTPHKHFLKGLDAFNEAEEFAAEKKELYATKELAPQRMISIPGKWLGRMSDGNTPMFEEEHVRKTFGDRFTDKLKQSKRGWVETPVGNYKPSRLHEHLGLKVIGAPEIQFVQSEGKDLCVTKCLASTFFALRWHDAASKIDAFGEDILKGVAVDALERVIKLTKSVFPPWIIICQHSTNFN